MLEYGISLSWADVSLMAFCPMLFIGSVEARNVPNIYIVVFVRVYPEAIASNLSAGQCRASVDTYVQGGSINAAKDQLNSNAGHNPGWISRHD